MKKPMLIKPGGVALISVISIIAVTCVVFIYGLIYNTNEFSYTPPFYSLLRVEACGAVLFSDYAGTGVSQTAPSGFGLIFAIFILLIVVSIVISLSISFGNTRKGQNSNRSGNAPETITTDEDKIAASIACIPSNDKLTVYINELSEMKKNMSEYKFEEILDIKNSFDKAVLSLVMVNEEADSNPNYKTKMINEYYSSCKKIYEIARVIDELSEYRNG